ncbi:Cof-type HAD-IIB family hydrolase [Gabonia massiliensis]|uniref:Cof-type HAD-IIB family hydrolase n=1 Tax=Gabonia massiliensis TaxID=1686296 RepID=UPI0006D82E0A|nr:Cof-type HAD-IIB family hydrolase [Gabonia massiliensis]
MNTKAIFFDIDGTLVSFDTHHVPQSAIEAVWQVHESGIKVIIATGRASTDLHEIQDIPYDAVIALNGSDCVLRDGTSIYREQISKEDFYKVQALARRYGFPLAVETDRGIFVNEINPTVIELARMVNHPVPPVADIEKEFIENNCCQLCIYCDEETEKEVMAQLPGLSVSRWNPYFTDVNVAGVNKAVGINKFAAYYGFEMAQTIAFGDGGNDIPMLRAVGTGIAMGGASETVKAAADYITGTVDENGIQNALIHFGIIQK